MGLEILTQLLHFADGKRAAGCKNPGGYLLKKILPPPQPHSRFPKFPCQVVASVLFIFPTLGVGSLFLTVPSRNPFMKSVRAGIQYHRLCHLNNRKFIFSQLHRLQVQGVRGVEFLVRVLLLACRQPLLGSCLYTEREEEEKEREDILVSLLRKTLICLIRAPPYKTVSKTGPSWACSAPPVLPLTLPRVVLTLFSAFVVSRYC